MKYLTLALSLCLLVACGGSVAPSPSAANATAAVTPCLAIEDLRSLGSSLVQVTNPATNDTMEYTIIGDAAVSSDVLVMFPGWTQTQISAALLRRGRR